MNPKTLPHSNILPPSLRLGACPAGLQFYTRALASEPSDSRVLSSRAACHYRMGQYTLCVQVKTNIESSVLLSTGRTVRAASSWPLTQ